MGNKVYRFFEYAYLVAAVFFTYQAIITWNEQRTRAYLFLFFVVIAIFMFFFKRNFRKKMENNNK